VEDPDGDLMDITINVTNADGGYQAVTYYNAGNGTYSYNLGHIGTYGKTYYWKCQRMTASITQMQHIILPQLAWL